MSTQMPPLHAEFEQIKHAEAKRKPRVAMPAKHTIEFSAGHTSLAVFVSEGPILVPSVGQRVMVHGVYVEVTEVDVAYEVTEDGRDAVFASIEVTNTEQ
ncbi:hypothetical protein [Streptomyces sp. NBC_01422]|uniref:hypothetical protein n=1 Tax=Streptomyces sp. NBC_01422 TaxID=2903859 RepID=UPI002E2C8700|nr:hypothetical protein [Streptomyces sp. NBC_01422]